MGPVTAHVLHVSDPNHFNALVVQQVTIKVVVLLLVLLVLLDVPSAQEEAILNVPAAPLATISNPLQLPVQILVQVMDTIQTPRRIAVLLVLLDVPSVQEAAIPNVPAAPLTTTSNHHRQLALLHVLQ